MAPFLDTFSSPNEEMLSVLSSDEGSMLQGKKVCVDSHVIYR